MTFFSLIHLSTLLYSLTPSFPLLEEGLGGESRFREVLDLPAVTNSD